MSTWLYPGSFDPVTIGHMDIITRASRLCGRLVVAVLHNPDKRGALPVPERVRLLKAACAGLGNVEVIARGGLTIECAAEVGAQAIVRGVRPIGDFDSEYQLAQINHALSGIETLMMTTSEGCSCISSSVVRQVAAFGGDITPMVPAGLAEDIRLALCGGQR
ncbi:MAG: pantetheine-phosphate adenylyltransferase [Clostridia bacterium]|nr:pantetheine-phosphate adenylyltransferase [Clostridia bacterium]